MFAFGFEEERHRGGEVYCSDFIGEASSSAGLVFVEVLVGVFVVWNRAVRM